MFDIKYDKDGLPIPTREPIPEQQVVKEESHSDTLAEQEKLYEKYQIEDSEVIPPAQDLTEEVTQTPEIQQAEEPQETSRERNNRALRELKEKAEKDRSRAEKERDEAILRARKLEEQYATRSQKVDDDDVDITIGEEDLVEGKHHRKLAKEVKELKKELRSSREQYKAQSLQDQLSRDYPDFNSVVTPENIEILRHLKPRQAQLLDSSNDLYTTAASAYEMIKEYGIYEDNRRVNRDRETVQKNLSKPKPTNSISPQRGDSPLSKAHDFANGWRGQDSPEAKATYREMLEAIKGR
jgi:hypothetical protein